MSEFPTINRYAVTLLPTEAFLDWAGSCPGGNARMTLGEMQREPTVYLIPEATKTPAEDYVRRHYKAMFEEELTSWYADPELWPKDLSFKCFKKFFAINISTVVYDLGKGPIEKDED